MKKMHPAGVALDELMRPHADRLATRQVRLGVGALEAVPQVCRELLPAGPWLVVSDPVTQTVAGARAVAALTAAGAAIRAEVLEPQAGERTLVADDAMVARVAALFDAGGPRATAAIAVGSGTVNDIVKLAAHRANRPYVVVATAPSMNGYTSAIAAILSRGVKTVQDARGPVACIADLDVLAAAPARMIASGFADLVSKPVSNADWLLSHHLTGSFYSAEVIRLVEASTIWLEGRVARLPARDRDAVAALTAALLASGYAMALAGTSAPASGGEHLISHYLDMTHHAGGGAHDLHGCQVGVATQVAAAFYEALLAAGPGAVEPARAVARLRRWPEYEEGIRARFGVLADDVLPYARAGYPAPQQLAARLERLQAEWLRIVAPLAARLRPAAAIRADLLAAGAPTTFAELGVTPERARRAVLDARDIRPRYTILHLAWELGRLEEWTDRVLPMV
jgi:glycerol-1-phosphate dehydrogenase [NAD(P)+]